jgi:hypothetical protein
VHIKLKLEFLLVHKLNTTEHYLFWRIVITTRPSVKTPHKLRVILTNSCTGGVSVATGRLSVKTFARSFSLSGMVRHHWIVCHMRRTVR